VHPNLGAAHQPYARTVKPMTMQVGELPDPGVIFDCLMSRKVRQKHPNRISSMLFYMASIIIHDLFRTSHEDFRYSETSSYLDLAPLYGSNEAEQKVMREGCSDGRIKADSFSEKRLGFFPPGVSVLMIMFNRFHNYVVENLASINENGAYTKPNPKQYDMNDAKKKSLYEERLRKYDNDLFQTGRLITCGLYINIILIDYVRTILNLNRTDSKWQLNPRQEIKGVPIGTGNQVSAEFNLVYRWHSAISERDEKWTEELYKSIFGEVDPKTIDERTFFAKIKEIDEKTAADPAKRDLHGLKRDPKTGKFPDKELVDILAASINDSANSFGARRVPAVMRSIEVLGIKQARTWNLATLNEFRKYFGLQPHSTFEDINDDEDVANTLKHLYGHPDQVEIYPGLVVEQGKKALAPGSGLCPSYTVSRAVLSDAVALVRGDRFYTTDYHPKKLTNWGYSEVQYDLDVNNGCVMYKLFARAFPGWFEQNSVYAHFPFTVPAYQMIALKDLKKDKDYSDAPPKFTPPPTMIFSYAAAEKILGDKATFNVTWGKAMEYLMGKPAVNFMLAGDGFENQKSREMMGKALYIGDWTKEVKDFYIRTTVQLLKEKSYKLGSLNQVDIVRDVGNLAHVRFCAELFMLPLKRADKPGVFNEYQLYMIMAAVFLCVFFDVDPGASFPLHVKAKEATQGLGQLVELNAKEIKATGAISTLFHKYFPEKTALNNYGRHLIERLLASDMPVKDLVWGHIMGTAGGMVPNQGQLLSQTFDYYFSEGKEHLSEIHRLAKSNDEKDFDTLMKYVLEGSRLYGETGVTRRVTKDIDIEDDGKVKKLKAGDTVLVNFRSASHDPKKWGENANKVDLNRPIESYIHLGAGPHQCLGLPMTRVALTAMFKVIGSLEGLKPASNGVGQGKIAKRPTRFDDAEDEKAHPLVEETATVSDPIHYHKYLTVNHDSYFPFPCSKLCHMHVENSTLTRHDRSESQLDRRIASS
jgi:linoleate 8R-lipoxygenase / 9,12-octadecadienoate 8-hydroperoxide 8R-isomerase